MSEDFLIDRRDILMKYNGQDETVKLPDGIKGVDTRAFENSPVKKVIFPESAFCCSGGNGLISSILEEITITNAEFSGCFVWSSLPSLKRFNVIDTNDVRRGNISTCFHYLSTVPDTIELYIPNLVLYSVGIDNFMDVKAYLLYLRNKHLYTEETAAGYEEYANKHKTRFLKYLIHEKDVELIKQNIRMFDPYVVASLYEELSAFEDIELNAVVSNILSKSDVAVKTDALDFSFLTNFFDDEANTQPTQSFSSGADISDIQKVREVFKDFEVRAADGKNVILGAYTGHADEITIPAELNGYIVEAIDVPNTRDMSRYITSITIEEGVSALLPMSFACYVSVREIDLPGSLKYISAYAFSPTMRKNITFKCKVGTYAWQWAKTNCTNVIEQ